MESLPCPGHDIGTLTLDKIQHMAFSLCHDIYGGIDFIPVYIVRIPNPGLFQSELDGHMLSLDFVSFAVKA